MKILGWISRIIPGTFGDATGLTIEGCTSTPSGQEVAASYRVVDQNDFRTMSIPLVVRLLARR